MARQPLFLGECSQRLQGMPLYKRALSGFFCPTQVGSQKSGEAGEMGESI